MLYQRRLKLRLSDIPDTFDFQVERDGYFENLGFITHARPKLLVFIEQEKFLEMLHTNDNVCSVVTTHELASQIPEQYSLAIVEKPRRFFYDLHNYLASKTEFYWENFENEISPSAEIHPRAFIADRNVKIGDGTIIEAGVNVLEKTVIGNEVILRSGCTVGTEGFQFIRDGADVVKIRHAGGVKIGNNVEVQANGAISRSIFGGFTELGDGTKLDNLVHVAHDVKIGKRCLLAAAAMIAGSVSMGDDVWVGPGVSVSSEIVIGDNANLTIGSVVTKNVESGQRVTGNFAIDHKLFIDNLKEINKKQYNNY